MVTIARQLDRVAIFLSGLCLLHCLLLPVVIALFPLLSIGLGGDEHFHELLLWFVLPVSTVGLALGWRHHRSVRALTLGVIAMAILAFAATWGHDNLPEFIEIALTVLGSLMLAVAHLQNFRHLRHCPVTSH
ncbi:MAG: MerC domain-containing protein [Gammaproteobacteria bacterium]|nr:MerC domain-containing protein [Gammaproteobacteria bacterium]